MENNNIAILFICLGFGILLASIGLFFAADSIIAIIKAWKEK